VSIAGASGFVLEVLAHEPGNVAPGDDA